MDQSQVLQKHVFDFAPFYTTHSCYYIPMFCLNIFLIVVFVNQILVIRKMSDIPVVNLAEWISCEIDLSISIP